MGADIHIIAEVKENGVWKRNTDVIFKNPYYDPKWHNEKVEGWRKRLEKGEITQKQFDNWCADDWTSNEFDADPSSSRNYDWFAVLADVRNGRGFAGVSTGEGFNVISMPKGLPSDLSVEGLKYFCMPIWDKEESDEVENEDGSYTYYVNRDSANRWMKDGYSSLHHIEGEDWVSNPDYHSNSFLSIEDFDAYDWNQLSMKYGVIGLDRYKELRGTNECPESWSGGIGGGNTITVSEDEADKILEGQDIELTRDNRNMFRPDAEPETKIASDWDVYVAYQWSVLYSEWFKRNIEDTVEPLRQLSEKYEDARIVFAFDN